MPRLLTLQVARGVAANLVVLAHLHNSMIAWTGVNILPTLTINGNAGVDLFFVLSGFIMVAVAGRNIGPVEFIWRRAARIYPTYWLASLLFLCSITIHDVIHSLPLVSSSLLWRSFLLVPQSSLPLLAVGWTLVFEMYFYLVFAVFLALRIPIFIGLIGWGISICGLLVLAPIQLQMSPVLHVVANPMTAEFMIGAVIAILWLNHRMLASWIVGVAGLAMLTIAAISNGYFTPARSFITSNLDAARVILFGVPAGLILYALAAMELRTPLPRVPRLAVKLGDWSYGTYLLHLLVIVVIGKTVRLFAPEGGVGAGFTLVVAGLIAANLAGAGAHIFFERPILRWLHSLGSKFQRPAGKPSEAIIEPMQSV